MLNEREKDDIKIRLRKTGGQINGIEKMVDEGRYIHTSIPNFWSSRIGNR